MDKTRHLIWQFAIAVFVVAVSLIILFRANPPNRIQTARPTPVKATEGQFVQGPLRVNRGRHLAFKFVLNARGRLVGNFAVENLRGTIECLVIEDGELQKFVTGADYNAVAATGAIPGGRIDRTLPPGTYHVVFDNRNGDRAVNVETADFSIE